MIATFCLVIFLIGKTGFFYHKNVHFFAGLYILIAALVFVALKINNGIVRHANTHDLLKVFIAVFTTSMLFAVAYRAALRFDMLSIKGLETALILNFFMASTALILLRIIIKGLYHFFKKLGIKKENVLIYGSVYQSLMIKKAIDQDSCSRLNVLCFLDNDLNKVNKYLEQKRIYPFSAIGYLKSKYQVKKILVAEDLVEQAKSLALAELCRKADIPFVKIPSAEKWLYGGLQAARLKDIKIDSLLDREPIRLDKQNILREIKGKCVLVTGAAGSIGAEIVKQVIGYQPSMVVLCDQAETQLHDLKLAIEDARLAQNVQVFMANIQNQARLRWLFDLYRPNIVFHAAAYKHVPMMEENPAEAILTNVLGTKNLADLCMEFAVEKFVMISTDKAVKPTNIMGASKRLAELYIQSLNNTKNLDNKKNKTRFITTRFGNVLGSNGSVIPRFISQIERRMPVTVTHPDITRYFMTISEAVELVLEAGAMGNGGEIFLFDMGKPVKIVDLALNMIKLAGLTPYVDVDIVFTGLRPGEKIYEELLLLAEEVQPTHHPKIKISKNAAPDFFIVNKLIIDLILLNQSGNDLEMVKKMKEILPEFVSNNSRYQALDVPYLTKVN